MHPANWRRAIFLILSVCLLVRVLHLAAAVNSPFTYHLGPDEDYYLRFGLWIAGLAPGDPGEFTFMDPAYGYLVGGIFHVFGQGKAAVLALQALMDTMTCLLIAFVGRELGRARAGLIGAACYALTATAVMYSATFLKASWVANALVLWVFLALVLLRTGKAWPWFLFGLYCGYCVALRGNLLLMLPLALILLPWIQAGIHGKKPAGAVPRLALLVVGMALPLLTLALRNESLAGRFTPLPSNGGTVLHQVYNIDNPHAKSWYPPFAAYSNPTDIVRGYSREAQRRAGRELSAGEVDSYWRGEAFQYIRAHPAAVAAAITRKTREFASHKEVANNRSLREEKLFSPLLRALPAPFGWLFALGIPGLLILAWQDRRAWLLIAPLLVVIATFAVFFAEARFRFHAVPLLALGSGLLLDQLAGFFRAGRRQALAGALSGVLLLAAVSAWAARQVPDAGISWDAIAWGYFKMGDISAAARVLETPHEGMEITDKWEEARGLLQWSRGNFEAAARHYRGATRLNPASHVAQYNLALTLQRIGDIEGARRHAALAVDIAGLPEYIQLQQSLGTR